MPLSAEEQNSLVDKLRLRYDEYAKKFSPKWFDRTAFETRLDMAKRSRMDGEAFILAEIANFEKVKDLYDKKKKDRVTFTQKVDTIIEENLARVKKYPAIDFHPRAGIEMKHLYGALSDLAQGYIPVLWLIFTDYHKKNLITELEHTLQTFALPRGNRPPSAIEDHILILNRAGVSDIEIEKARNSYLKESAFLLYDIITFCDSFLNEKKNADLENPVRFDKAFFAPDIKKRVIDLFSSSTGYGALVLIRTYCEEVLSDFRLTAFKPGMR